MKISMAACVGSLCLVTLTLSHPGIDTSVCTPPADPGSLTNRPKIPSQFYMHVEAVFVRNKTTKSIKEYFDYPGNKGRIQIVEDGLVKNIYYSYATNELITVIDQICLVENLSTNHFLLGYNSSNSGLPHIFSAASAMQFGNTGSINQYQGNANVRGIRADHWYTCLYWPSLNATMNVDWYFSVKSGWDTALGLPQTPLRLHVKGSIQGQGRSTRPFEHYYEFYHFRQGSPRSSTLFETPTGVQCPGRKLTRTFPEAPQTMTFSTEIIDNVIQTSNFMKEEYDYLSNLVKFTYLSIPFYSMPIYNGNPLVEIHDFNTGVAYIIDQVFGNCTVRPIETNQYDVDRNDIHGVRIQTSKQFLGLSKGLLTYEGVKSTRGFDCHIWIATRTGWPPSNPNANSTWEWYFQVSDYLNFIGSSVQSGSLVQQRVSIPASNIDMSFNIFEFTQERPDILTFDVSACYLKRLREKFSISISADFKAVISIDMKKFKFFLMAAITGALGVTPIRVQNLRVDTDVLNILVTFEIVDVAPPIGDVENKIKEVPLADAVRKFKNLIKNKQFLIQVIYKGFNNPIEIRPEPTFDFDTTYRQGVPPTRYTMGSFLGLTFAMLGLGLIIGFLLGKKYKPLAKSSSEYLPENEDVIDMDKT